jgi:heterotetrameric sarcosine oxidase gamma subunit
LTISEPPVRLSPLHTIHAEAGAALADVAGWQVVQRYGHAEDEATAVGESAGVCDITGRAMLRVKSFDLDGVLGAIAPEVGSIVGDDDRVIARLTDEEALVIGSPSAKGDWKGGIDPSGEPARYITDVTSGMTGLKIAGPRAHEVISSLTDLDMREASMPYGSCAQAGFAQVHGTLLRREIGGLPDYELYVAREFGVYVWEAVLESLGHGGVVPFGHETLTLLEQGR